jgi:hypothetical protein
VDDSGKALTGAGEVQADVRAIPNRSTNASRVWASRDWLRIAAASFSRDNL